ncbi:MAG TPA: ATP-binding cassette domain-containing protein [Candidatus Binatia bacterium]|nr:ATP-binding cassette domain-containing protein [Candidatus Binatia bacterium]
MKGPENSLALRASELRKSFVREGGDAVTALDGVTLEVAHGALTALAGPDGAGKTTLIRLAAGLMTADSGELRVLGVDVSVDPQQVQERIGYMPQKFGLYEDLSVQENLDLYADLHGVSLKERRERYPRLMEMTALGRFTDRLAGRLSGGMKQKLGLACTLVRAPELLLLDEPTVGVDPLSRRELWEIILQLVNEQELTVLLSTSYLDEAERCAHVVVLHQGSVLAQGRPSDISQLAEGRTYLAEPPSGQKAGGFQARLLDHPEILDALPEGGRVRFVTKNRDVTKGIASRSSLVGASVVSTPPRFEDGFMILLRHQMDKEKGRQGEGEKDRQRDAGIRTEGDSGADSGFSPALPLSLSPRLAASEEAAVEVRDLVRRFGTFTAVDHVSFDVRRGEIFGLLGPNGAGKTTTFRMLCGLLPASGGTLRVGGMDLRRARASARQRIGYVAQKFSLYSQLTVIENLEFFASAYNLRADRRDRRISWALEQFELTAFASLPSGQLPGGYKQRLAMAAALVHEPETLFLDEPTSGADPLARREFWRRIVALAEQSVTVIVTTHFMEEAEYCDRIAIMDAGRVLAQGTPAEIRRRARQQGGEPSMEDAFIAIVEDAREAVHGANGAAA